MVKIKPKWEQNTLYSEYTWHQLSPFIGRMKSSMARSLVEQFSAPGETVYDPFSGAGTVPLEAWAAGRQVIAGDISPYAYVLSKAKLNPPQGLQQAEQRLLLRWKDAERQIHKVDLRNVPPWIRSFFHKETLREVISLRNVLLQRREHFLLCCLLGILHHWRPGFLSYPASHIVPHLKWKRFPKEQYPELYKYREVLPRLLAKVRRAFKRIPTVDRGLRRKIQRVDANKGCLEEKRGSIGAIITSPPYMNSLSYARDNRLRLWFLGVEDCRELEPIVSPTKTRFLNMIGTLILKWGPLLKPRGICVLVLGSVRRDGREHDLPEAVNQLTKTRSSCLRVEGVCKTVIPDIRRARSNCRGTREDTILVLGKRS